MIRFGVAILAGVGTLFLLSHISMSPFTLKCVISGIVGVGVMAMIKG